MTTEPWPIWLERQDSVRRGQDELPLDPSSPWGPTNSGAFSSPGAMAEESPDPRHRGPWVRVDDAFVQFLREYAAYDTECPPLFKTYLEEVALRPGPGDLTGRVQALFRHAQPRDYNFGPTFMHQLEMHTVYNYSSEGTGSEDASPTLPPISDWNQPMAEPTTTQLTPTQLTPGPVADLDSVGSPSEATESDQNMSDQYELVETESEDAASDSDYEDEDEDDQVTEAMLDRLHALEGERRPRRRTPSVLPASNQPTPAAASAALPRTSNQPAQAAASSAFPGTSQEGTGQLSSAIQRLRQSIQPLRRTGSRNLLYGMADRTGPDWRVSSWYKGGRQPPLAARLETVINFLTDEDVYRCINWETSFAEISAYLQWLEHDDDRHQLDNASQETRAMFDDAATKVKAHVLFEKHHYDPTTVVIRKPPQTSLTSTRLNWTANIPGRSKLLPRSITPRPLDPINRLPMGALGNRSFYDRFAEDGKKWWQRIAASQNLDAIPADAEGPLERANLAYIEAQSFDSSSRGENLAPPADGAQSWAVERGARRAGLQQVLRAVPTNLPSQLNTSWRRAILATPAATLRKARESAEIPQWTPPSLDRSQLPEQLGTMPYTVSYRERLKKIKMMREVAWLRGEDKYGRDPNWVTLPQSFVNGDPLVSRLVDLDAQARRDLLKQCYTAVEMLKAAGRRVPRALLNAVRVLLEGEEESRFPHYVVPEGVDLAVDEWEEQAGQRPVPKCLDLDDVKWLKFLAGECVNGRNWTGRLVPDTPKDKYRLFLIFATRVQKLLDDKNPEGLFSQHDAKVSVEDLLGAVNAGTGSTAVAKYEFHPYEACAWLDRMKESGHVRFNLDPTCYGVIERPATEYFPEHRVLWPTGFEDRDRPSYSLGYFSDWERIIQGGGEPDIREGSDIWNFFLSLAFRLRYTISMLEWEKAGRTRGSRHPPTQKHVRKAINKWEEACADLQVANPEPISEELDLIRTKIIDELFANSTMLAPGRLEKYFDGDGNPQSVLVRDHNWDWASLAARGQTKRRQFWFLDRWPLDSGYLSERAERAVKDDEDLDPAMTYDPAAMDPIDKRYMKPKLQQYWQQKVEFRSGPAVFAVGDTRLQKDALEERVEGMVKTAYGPDTKNKSFWCAKLGRLNPFSCSCSKSGCGLPPVDSRHIPKSWDPLC